AAVAGGSIAVVQSVHARRESDRAARAARIATAYAAAQPLLANHKGDQEGSILAAIEAIEITRRADGFVLPEALQAMSDALGLPDVDEQAFVPGAFTRAPPGELTANALVLTDDRLLELARARVKRPITP